MNSSEPFVYYGTSEFSAAILRGLLQAGLTPSLVVSALPKPAGRGLTSSPSPVTILAQSHKIPVLEVKTLKSSEALEQLTQTPAHYAVLAALGKIIPQNLLDLYPKGIINVHPSLLPAYRGPSPIQSALLSGAPETGVSLILLDAEVDHGPLLAQATEPITPTDDAITLSAKLAKTALGLLLKTLPMYLGGTLQPVAQDHDKASFTSMVERAQGQADFKQPALELDRKRRAYAPWPGLWTTWQGKRLKLIATAPAELVSATPGTIELSNGQLRVACAGSSLVLSSLQLEGGKTMTAEEFVRGHRTFVGSTLPS